MFESKNRTEACAVNSKFHQRFINADLVVLQHTVAKCVPVSLCWLRVSAMQALVSAIKLLGDCRVDIHAEYF